MNEAKLKELLSDEAFLKELLEMENLEDVRDALNAKGAEITVDEVKAIAKSLSQQTEGELDEDALEDVAGGFTIYVTDPQVQEQIKEKLRTNPGLVRNRFNSRNA